LLILLLLLLLLLAAVVVVVVVAVAAAAVKDNYFDLNGFISSRSCVLNFRKPVTLYKGGLQKRKE